VARVLHSFSARDRDMNHIGAPIPTTLTITANPWPATTSARDLRVWDETPIACPRAAGRKGVWLDA
jgi:hypothetical protein